MMLILQEKIPKFNGYLACVIVWDMEHFCITNELHNL